MMAGPTERSAPRAEIRTRPMRFAPDDLSTLLPACLGTFAR